MAKQNLFHAIFAIFVVWFSNLLNIFLTYKFFFWTWEGSFIRNAISLTIEIFIALPLFYEFKRTYCYISQNYKISGLNWSCSITISYILSSIFILYYYYFLMPSFSSSTNSLRSSNSPVKYVLMWFRHSRFFSLSCWH